MLRVGRMMVSLPCKIRFFSFQNCNKCPFLATTCPAVPYFPLQDDDIFVIGRVSHPLPPGHPQVTPLFTSAHSNRLCIKNAGKYIFSLDKGTNRKHTVA